MDVAARGLLAVVPRSSDAAFECPAYVENVIVPPRITRTLVLAVVAMVPAAVAQGSSVPGAPLCPMAPANSFWHADVSKLPVDPHSAAWISSVGATAGLKADFGSGTWDGGPIGIPFTTVPGTQPKVPVAFGYADESDAGPYPVPPDAPIEGGSGSTGDRHVLVVDRDACRLWELFDAHPQNGGASWTAGSGATWDLNSNAMRPLGWTSGDAAGLPILPGLVRYDEVAAGEIDHVIRFTAPRTQNAYVWPASHKAGSGTSSDPPMGAWFRLKASYDISHFSAQNQVILRALKEHGMILADNGSPFFMSGAPDSRWNNSDLNALKSIPGSAFEAVDVSSLKVSSTSYAVAGAPPPPPPPPPPAPPVTTTTPAPAPPPPAGPAPAPSNTPASSPPAAAKTPAQPVSTTGFETDLGGWKQGNSLTTLARSCATAHSGRCSAVLGRRGRSGTASLDAPRVVAVTTAGATYVAALWVRAPAHRLVTLRLREQRGGTVVRSELVTVSGNGRWERMVVRCSAAGGGSLRLDLLAMLTKHTKVYVDDLSVASA
jgi:hypothetical protein